jgi:hypothetical protein
MGRSKMGTPTSPEPYVERLLAELELIATEFEAVIESSVIKYVNPNTDAGGLFFVGAADWGWAESEPEHERQRMALLAQVRGWQPRFQLMFPNPTPEVAKRHGAALDLLERWLVRDRAFDHSIPQSTEQAARVVRGQVEVLLSSRALLPEDEHPIRVVFDSNALIDNPDLAAYTDVLGSQYRVHIPPVVLGELDELKRGGRSDHLRHGAARAGRRLKGLRDNGDVLVGVTVAGAVSAVFEHIEPRSDGLPGWLDLSVPDDRFVASALLLQSRHPGSLVYVVTGDLNMQTKLHALGLPFLETAELPAPSGDAV